MECDAECRRIGGGGVGGGGGDSLTGSYLICSLFTGT